MTDKNDKIIILRTDNKFSVFTFTGDFAFYKLYPVFSGSLEECNKFVEKWEKEHEQNENT